MICFVQEGRALYNFAIAENLEEDSVELTSSYYMPNFKEDVDLCMETSLCS